MTPTPEQIALAIKLRAEGVQRAQVIFETGINRSAFDRLIKKGLIPRQPHPPRKRLEPPADFAKTYQENSIEACAGIFHVSKETATRWARDLGIIRKPCMTLAQKRGVKPPPRKPNRYLTAARAPISQAVMDEAGRAAEYLRPDYRPVYRCDEEGRQNPAGRMYRCGTRLFSPQQVIERAAEIKARRERMRSAA